MNVVQLIRRKRDGGELDEEDLRELVDRYTDEEVPDYQMAAFLMAVYFNSMTGDELGAWTDAMLRSGEVLDMNDMEGVQVDKHSTGGVGDKVSLVLAPLAAAAGLKVPMISGRGLGHTGGTLDKLESIPGFDVDQSVEDFRRLVREVGAAMIGQTAEIAPADGALYQLRDVTGTVECIPLIASSIMSKKLAEGLDGLVLDVKVGSGAFMKERDEAAELAETMIDIGESMGTDVRALMTDMDQPLGRAVGNGLEAIESVEALKGEGPEDLERVVVELVAEMRRVGGADVDLDAERERLREMLHDGTALEKFREMVDAQGGDPRVVDEPREVVESATTVDVWRAPTDGRIERMDAEKVGLASLELGAGRETKEDEIDPAVGLVFECKRGAEVEEGDPVVEIHRNAGSDVETCRSYLDGAIEIGDGAVEERPLVMDRFS